MKKVFQDLPNWSFDMDEVSAGIYEIIGRDSVGHCISAKGVDLNALIEECRCEAIKLAGQSGSASQ